MSYVLRLRIIQGALVICTENWTIYFLSIGREVRHKILHLNYYSSIIKLYVLNRKSLQFLILLIIYFLGMDL